MLHFNFLSQYSLGKHMKGELMYIWRQTLQNWLCLVRNLKSRKKIMRKAKRKEF